MYRLVLLSILVTGVFGQALIQGVCNYTAIGGYVTDLNIVRMLGNWNQIARIEHSAEVGECASATLTGTYDVVGNLNGVQASFLEVVNTTTTYHNGTFTQEPNVEGLFYMNVTGFLEGNFVVQATNYTDYAILYACYTVTEGNEAANVNATKMVWAWQYHRKMSLSSAEETSLKALVDQNPDLASATWKFVNHNDTACGRNVGVPLAGPQLLVILATLFISKEFV